MTLHLSWTFVKYTHCEHHLFRIYFPVPDQLHAKKIAVRFSHIIYYVGQS